MQFSWLCRGRRPAVRPSEKYPCRFLFPWPAQGEDRLGPQGNGFNS